MTEIRKFIPVLSEYKQAIAIESANFPDEDINIESWKWYDQHFDPNTVFSRWVGEMDGRIISHGLFTQLIKPEQKDETHFMMHIAVHPDQQFKGYGSELFVHLHRHLQQYIPCKIETIVREDKPHSSHFLEHRHFKVTSTQYISRLPLPSGIRPLDLTKYTSYLSSLGIRIESLAGIMETDGEWENKLYSQQKNIFNETKQNNDFFPDLHEFKIRYTRNPLFNPQQIFIACYHEHWIGCSGIKPSDKHKHTCIHTQTGVDRPYRRNGIATALIQHCINAAIESGYTAIESYAPIDNPMFDLHKKIGYKVQPCSYRYELSLV